MEKTLDTKLARIASDSSCRDFILADAKDADMAYGIAAPGIEPNCTKGETRFRSLQQYRDAMRDIARQQLVDILLMSASSSEQLTNHERLFDESPITPAIRANDTTDIWLAGNTSAKYGQQPSLPFRTADLEHAMEGAQGDSSAGRLDGVSLGLYSITLNNDAPLDRATLEAYGDFRREAQRKGFRHFLEVFAPNACDSLAPEEVPRFVNDSVARILAGVSSGSRPLFLKIPYFGPAAMSELVSYDSSLVVGILGGSAGTTLDAFHMLWEAKQNGARAALYGRKINNAEHQLTFVRYLYALANDQLEPAEAVKAYHDDLEKLKIPPRRTLAKDLERTPASFSYAGS